MTRDLLARLLADLEAKRAVVVATDLATGDARLVHPDAPEPGLSPDLLAAARDAAARDASGEVAIASGTVFLHVHLPPVRLLVVGAVHLAQPLTRMAVLAGLEPLVVDPRPAFATAARFEGVPLLVEWPGAALAGRLDRRTAVVTVTHDPKIDDPALAAALRSDAFYVGALGSRRTQAARRERLRAMGLGEAELARLHGPVGLSIGARTPGEIAVSILAAVVEALRVRASRAEG